MKNIITRKCQTGGSPRLDCLFSFAFFTVQQVNLCIRFKNLNKDDQGARLQFSILDIVILMGQNVCSSGHADRCECYRIIIIIINLDRLACRRIIKTAC